MIPNPTPAEKQMGEIMRSLFHMATTHPADELDGFETFALKVIRLHKFSERDERYAQCAFLAGLEIIVEQIDRGICCSEAQEIALIQCWERALVIYCERQKAEHLQLGGAVH